MLSNNDCTVSGVGRFYIYIYIAFGKCVLTVCVCQCFPFSAGLTQVKLPNWVTGNIYFLSFGPVASDGCRIKPNSSVLVVSFKNILWV